MADIVPAPCESLHVLSPGEDLAAKHGEIEQWDSSGDKGHKCAQSRALHAESQSPDGHFVAEDGEGACGENEEEVENHVEAAHQHGDGAGATHVATHLEHGGGEVLYQMDGDGEGEDQKIHRRIVLDVGSSAQPAGQGKGYQGGDGHEQEADQEAEGIAMAHDGPRPCEVVSPDKVCGLYTEAHRDGTDERSEKPGGRLDETDGGRGFRSQTAHH